MGNPHCDPECQQPASPPPTEEDLGIYKANGHLEYDADANGLLMPRLVLDERELRPIWEKEGMPRGIGFKQFMKEAEGLGTSISREAYGVFNPVLDQLAGLPGNVRFRYFRICVCWRWICIYVWVRIG